ncbi:DMT family transporter [Azohydromonas australica]|uniref:DMT family transporter n=1 Tax=Azohydromonas australica TaxID=364039 RepID=UPI0009FCAFCD|nr:DMT family transporter [Azohydromonas australica]
MQTADSKSRSLIAIAPLLVGTGVCLGLGIPFAKLAGAQGAGVLLFATLPTAVAGAMLLLLGLLRAGVPAPPAVLLRFGITAGLLGHALPMSALYWLTARAGASFAALAFTLPAVFTLAIVLLLRLEPPTFRRAAAVALGCAGAALLVLGRGLSFSDDLTDVLLVVAIPASIAAGNVYRSRCMPPGVDGEWLSAVTLLSSAVMLAGATAVAPFSIGSLAGAWHWLAAQALALVVGYLLYFALQRKAEPVTFSFMGYVSMLTGVAAGTLVFGEHLPWSTVPALVLIFLALLLLNTSPAAISRAPRP